MATSDKHFISSGGGKGLGIARPYIGDITNLPGLLALLCFVIMGGLLAGILVTTTLSIALGVTPMPERWDSLPPSLAPTFLTAVPPHAYSPGAVYRGPADAGTREGNRFSIRNG